MDCKIIFISKRHGEQKQNVVLFPPTCFYSFITLKKSEANCSPRLSQPIAMDGVLVMSNSLWLTTNMKMWSFNVAGFGKNFRLLF